MKILIAEDEADISQIYYRLLKRRGHDVIITQDGMECVSVYRNEINNEDKLPIDVVVLDHIMPGKDGVQTTKEILEENPNQRIVFVSAYGEKLLAGLDGISSSVEFLSKPTTPDALINFIEKTPKNHWKDKFSRKVYE